MGRKEILRRVLEFDYWRSWMVDYGWRWTIAPFAYVIVLGGVMILGWEVIGMGSRTVEGEIVSLGAFIAVIAVAVMAGVIAWFGVEALQDRLPPATSERVGLVAFWVAVLAIVGVSLGAALSIGV